MILNKYELRKHLSQQRNLIFTHHNYNSYNNTNNNPSSNASSSSQQPSNQCQQQQQQPDKTKLAIIRSKLSSNPPITSYQHQFSSGYNSENHSNSSQCTTATTSTTNNCMAGCGGVARNTTPPNDDYPALFNFYRLTLNHLPANFSNTLCTCSAATSRIYLLKTLFFVQV